MAAGATYEPIATQTLASAAASITFSSIAASWTDLRVVLIATNDTSSNAPTLQFNGDTATNYSLTYIDGNGTTAASGSSVNRSNIFFDGLGSATYPLMWTIDIFSYAGSTNKTCLTTGSSDFNGAAGSYVHRMVGLWRSTSAITSINLYKTSNNFAIGTTATLYGIKAA